MTQDEFGTAIGLSGATIGKYEIQQRTPQLGQVIANSVQLRFGVPAEWLLTGAESGPGPESTVSGFAQLYAVAA
jgi:transcriptional regulator with XRE-family HTH domain